MLAPFGPPTIKSLATALELSPNFQHFLQNFPNLVRPFFLNLPQNLSKFSSIFQIFRKFFKVSSKMLLNFLYFYNFVIRKHF